MGKNYSEIEEYLIGKNFQKNIDKLAKKYKNKRIMVYGASIAFDVIRKNYDLSALNIIGIADIRFNDGDKLEGYENYKLYNSYSFLKEKPDAVFIGMLESEVARQFFEDTLIPQFGDFKYEILVKKTFKESLNDLLASNKQDNENLKVSVITVCYNAQNEIEDTIKSVISQSFQNIEYIIIDGGSTDSTLNIIEQYRNNIQVLISEKDRGIFFAMNKGIAQATGDLLIFINAGDSFYSSEALEKAVSFIRPDSRAQIFFGDINVLVENGASWIRTFKNTDKITLISNCLCHQATLYRRELFEKIGTYDEKFKVISEHDFNLKAIIKNNIKAQYTPVIISNFSMGGDSTARHRIANTSQIIRKMAIKNYGKFQYNFLSFILLALRSIPCRKTQTAARKFLTAILGLNL